MSAVMERATTPSDLAGAKSLEALYDGLATRGIGAGWAKPTPSLYSEPCRNFLPHAWSWADGKAALDAAGGLISTELAERRNLILFNPVEGNTYATVRTLIAAYQMILPGETARSHRHTPNALRFVLEGEGSYTIVDGARIDMRPNDVLLTPNWHWHGHASVADGPCYWMDCLDAPTVHLLEPMFFETHPDGVETPRMTATESPFVFTWESVQRALDKTAPDPSGRCGTRIELGSPALDTAALYMQRIPSGTATRRYRTTANHIFACAEGSGATEIDGETFAWRRGDVVAVPGWRPFCHRAEHDATLFSMTDEPLLRALHWLRSEDA